MICVYPADCTDFSNNGLGAVTPMSCTVTETLNGEWQLTLVHDMFELTPLCNLKCKMCYVRLSPEQLGEEEIKKLEELKWWDWPEEKLAQYGSSFDDVSKLLKE